MNEIASALLYLGSIFTVLHPLHRPKKDLLLEKYLAAVAFACTLGATGTSQYKVLSCSTWQLPSDTLLAMHGAGLSSLPVL